MYKSFVGHWKLKDSAPHLKCRTARNKLIFNFFSHQWENHNKSLQLEAQTYQRIQEKIQERVMNNLGTWIDWQYLHNAAKLLAKVLWLHACMGSELQRWKCRNGEADAHRGKLQLSLSCK